MFGSNLTLFPHTLIAYHARLAHTSVFLKSLVFPPPLGLATAPMQSNERSFYVMIEFWLRDTGINSFILRSWHF